MGVCLDGVRFPEFFSVKDRFVAFECALELSFSCSKKTDLAYCSAMTDLMSFGEEARFLLFLWEFAGSAFLVTSSSIGLKSASSRSRLLLCLSWRCLLLCLCPFDRER